MDLKRVLRYYLQSDDFKIHFELFFETYRFFVEDIKCFDDIENKQYSETETYKNIITRIKKEKSVELDLSSREIRRCFKKSYTEKQVFAVVFAHWYHLSKQQIKAIRKREQRNFTSWDKLNCYILEQSKR